MKRKDAPPPMYSKQYSVVPHTLLIVDDHAIIRSGLTGYLSAHSDWRVVGTFSNSRETLAFLSSCDQNALPEIIIFDIQLANEMSFDLIRSVTKDFPPIKSVAFTMFDTTGFILAAKECGAKGYVSKTQSEAELLASLEKVSAGEECFPTSQEKEQKLSQAEHHLAQLTKQQRRLYQEILMGKTNEEIAASMNLKLHTVEVYITRMYEKLGIFNRDDILTVQ